MEDIKDMQQVFCIYNLHFPDGRIEQYNPYETDYQDKHGKKKSRPPVLREWYAMLPENETLIDVEGSEFKHYIRELYCGEDKVCEFHIPVFGIGWIDIVHEVIALYERNQMESQTVIADSWMGYRFG